MMDKLSVAQLYPLALAEGEGVGTAYEYLAKRLVLGNWFGASFRPKRILVAGLPEKYGSSLDFALIGHEFESELTVSDERPAALEKFRSGVERAQAQGLLNGLAWQARQVDDLAALDPSGHDLVLVSEVLQRVREPERQQYVAGLRQAAERVALFCPNGDNQAHTDLSGLSGVTLEELGELTREWAFKTGFIDLPPFPPGVTRTDEQRVQATSGRLEALAMAGLGAYARIERYIPAKIRRSQSHIVFALSRPS